MSIAIFPIPVPSSGDGSPVDISSLAGSKTVTLSGTFKGSYVLLGSHNGVKFSPLLAFSAGGPEGIQRTLDGSLAAVKLRSLASSSSGVAASISGISMPGDNSFGTFAPLSPGTCGPQPSVDLGLTDYQSGLNFIANGDVQGSVVVEGSLDNVRFNPIGAFTEQPASASFLGASPLSFSPLPTNDLVRYVRLNIQGVILSSFTVTFGGSQDSSSGSGTGLTPVAVNGSTVTATDGQLLQCNYTATGAVAVQLPTGMVGVVDSGGGALSGNHPITVTAPAGYTFLWTGTSTFVIGAGASLPEFAANGCSATFVTNSTTMKVEVI
jgi:hypothetical protein